MCARTRVCVCRIIFIFRSYHQVGIIFFIDCPLDVGGGILAKRGKLEGVFGSVYLMPTTGGSTGRGGYNYTGLIPPSFVHPIRLDRGPVRRSGVYLVCCSRYIKYTYVLFYWKTTCQKRFQKTSG